MNELFFVVTLVAMLLGGQQVGTATGFFYAKSDSIFFVTNRHVVIDEKRGLRPDALRVRLHTNHQDLSENVDRIIPLYQNGRQRWHDHKNYPKVPIDIAVIEFDRNLLQGTFIKTLHGKSIYAKDRSAFAPGDDIIVLGFPRGLSDSTHNLALMRNALIASPYGINFSGEPKFLVDANLHPGMSGSPVMTKPRTTMPIEKGGVRIYQTPVSSFLGVFSATLSWGKEALGLGEVWYADLIEEIIENMKLSTEEK